jgi:hypothetical protein
VQLRDYAGPVRVLAAAVIGFSLLCSVSALAMNDLSSYDRSAVESLDIVDLAVENISTSVAFTQQAVNVFVPTPTVVPTDTAFLTPLPSDTATVLPSATPHLPTLTRTRRPRATATVRSFPTRTRTPLPPATNTEAPPTDTPLPPPTQVEIPATDTSLPPAADTEIPPPTEPPTQNSDATQIAAP